MYDTVRLVKEGNYLNRTPSLFNNAQEHRNSQGFYYVTGTIGNGQRVKVFSDRICFAGSLGKYLIGDNIGTITRSMAEESLEKLSDHLSVDMWTSEVKRIDVGATIKTNYVASAYFPLFGPSVRYRRESYKGSLYYRIAHREKVIYDKKKEILSKRGILPTLFNNNNLTRLEVRYMGNLLKFLNRSSLKAFDIVQEGFYISMLDRWLEEYKNIKKLAYMELQKEYITKPKELVDQITIALLHQLDDDIFTELEQLIGHAKEIGVFDKSSNRSRDFGRAKQMLLERLTKGARYEMIEELDQKFMDQIRFYR